jgi:hypothetical protein
MRELTSHKVNGLNEALTIEVLDEPGQGGASHHYRVTIDRGDNIRDWVDIHFQNGPIKEFGVNGLSQEALLAIVLDRLLSFQAGPYACQDNAEAAFHATEAMNWMQKRTKERMARGVEGTSVK